MGELCFGWHIALMLCLIWKILIGIIFYSDLWQIIFFQLWNNLVKEVFLVWCMNLHTISETDLWGKCFLMPSPKLTSAWNLKYNSAFKTEILIKRRQFEIDNAVLKIKKKLAVLGDRSIKIPKILEDGKFISMVYNFTLVRQDCIPYLNVLVGRVQQDGCWHRPFFYIQLPFS